jgi:cytidylate kinase
VGHQDAAARRHRAAGPAHPSIPHFTPDGTRVIASYETGRAYLWDIRPEALARRACEVAGRPLTRAEWADALPGREYAPACASQRRRIIPPTMIIAIDGPAGAGKSSVARAVARELGFTYLDTGAMYRAVALAAAETGRPPAQVAETIEIELGDSVHIDGRDATEAIRAPEISEAASRVAADPAVRAALVAKQRALIAAGDWVAEGRDIALVVAPDAEVKVFLTAEPEERARRRAAEHGGDPEEIRREQDARDRRDATGARSVNTPAPDAVPVDTTGLTLDEVVDQVITLAVEAREMS